MVGLGWERLWKGRSRARELRHKKQSVTPHDSPYRPRVCWARPSTLTTYPLGTPTFAHLKCE